MSESNLQICEWNEVANGPLSVDSIREIYIPAERHRVSKCCYPAGAKFEEVMREGTCYVLHGSCRFIFRNEVVFLRVGQYAKLPEGGHVLEVVGEDELQIVMVWKLPFDVPSNQ